MTVLPEIKPRSAASSVLREKSPLWGNPPGNLALREAVALLVHYSKDERIRAAKLIHQTAAIHPQEVAPFLAQLLPALEQPETPTRWMILRAIGLCAALEPETAISALPKAQHFLATPSGATLWNATTVYLGNVGATSSENANRVLPLLEQALNNLPQLTKAILESQARLLEAADIPTMIRISETAVHYTAHNQAGVRATANKIVKRVSDCGLTSLNPPLGLSFTHQVQMSVLPERVYDAFTRADELNRWLTSMAFVDARPGGAIHWRCENWGSPPRTIEDGGPVLEAVRPERFVFKRYLQPSEISTIVEVNFLPAVEGCSIRLIESGFEASPAGQQALDECSTRWLEALEKLKHYLENDV